MEIRVATLTNINSLLQIENEIFKNNPFALSRRNFLYHLKKKHIIVAIFNEKIVGYLLYLTYKISFRIYSIGVLKSYQNQKIGWNLIQKSMEIAKSIRLNKILLEVNVSNQKAIEFYEKHGFKKIKIIKNYYLNEDGYQMELVHLYEN